MRSSGVLYYVFFTVATSEMMKLGISESHPLVEIPMKLLNREGNKYTYTCRNKFWVTRTMTGQIVVLELMVFVILSVMGHSGYFRLLFFWRGLLSSMTLWYASWGSCPQLK
eukprot:TRINITY_DN12824_c0_g3_i3.p1 TRINITY_DN12824_c0_g3~~TRINITY_DN12824_c0_g3_i3.p1  ORF type:complete len:111 (-),score=4.89 TRINITY_DN12824_c0_g3_i3:12-344(-)